MATTRRNPAAVPKILQEDLEDISLFEPVVPRRHSGGNCPIEVYSPVSSISSADDHSLSSNASNPTLVSDNSSLRSSLSSFSSPALVSTSGPFTTRPSTFATPPLPHINDSFPYESTSSASKPEFHAFTDQTSMASLSRLPSRRMRTRKQRELDFDNDVGEDFWLQDGLMFNVPMSPALYMQQKNRRNHHPQAPVLGHRRQGSDKASHQRRPSGKPIDPSNNLSGHSNLPRLPQHHTRRKSSARSSNAALPSIKETDAQISAKSSARVYVDTYDSSEDLSLASMMEHNLSFDYAEEAAFTSSPIAVKARSTSLPCLNTKLPLPTPVLSASSSPRRTSLTRPDHLPPKTPDEEKKHLDEYGKIMARAVEHERKKHREEDHRIQVRQQQINADTALWQGWLKNPSSLSSSRLRQLWWRGVPQRVRGSVWLSQVGNSLEVTLDGQALAGNESEIIKDSANVWPELGIFQTGRPLHASLIRVVRSFLGLHHNLQYKSALSSIAGLLLLELDEESAFVVLCNMLENSLPLAVMSGDEQTSNAHYTSYYKVFRAKFNRLNAHFNTIRIAPQHYLDEMIMNMFTDRVDVDTAAHIIDAFLFEGDGFLLQAALGVLRSSESRLYLSRDEVLEALSGKVMVSDEVLFDHISRATN